MVEARRRLVKYRAGTDRDIPLFVLEPVTDKR